MTDTEFWQAIHAALLKQAHDLQEERAAVLQQASVIEQRFGFRRNAVIKLEASANSTFSGFVVSEPKGE